MNRVICSLLVLLLFSTVNIFAQYEEEISVSIYADASEAHLGRAENRERLITVRLEKFIQTETIAAGTLGISTAVMVDASVKQALDKLLENRDYAVIENSIFTRTEGPSGDIYGFIWDRYGFEIHFMFESLDDALLSEIEQVYPDDAYLLGEVKRSYDDNYSLRIVEAENILTPDDDRIEFDEAMLSATVVGSTFQPMLGIRDGLGVLNMLGLAAVRFETGEKAEYVDYRKFTRYGDEIYSFLHTIEGMPGDFIDNLYSSFEGITRRHEDDGIILLPEELFGNRYGDNTDFAMFYFDILKRNDYQVRFIVIDPGEGELYSTVLFRETGTELWGRIDGNSLDREWAAKWQRIPALIFTASVKYFEPDIEEIINQGKIELPPPSQWASSLY